MAITLEELVDRFGGQLIGDGRVPVVGFAPLDNADADHITFLTNPRLRNEVSRSKAAALIISPKDNQLVGDLFGGARIVAKNPYAYFAKAAQLFVSLKAVPPAPGIHPSAVIDPSAKVAPSATIGPFVTIEAGAEIGENCLIEAGCFIGKHAKVGAGCHFFPRVVFMYGCEIGERGVLRPGAVIGCEGFGFANEDGVWIKIPQTGRVVIGNDVQIGANTTVDRGALSDTIIENGVKLDNQIQIGHNCHIGENSAMAGCVGVAGSAIFGKNCTVGGAAMIGGHLTIADRVHITAASVVQSSVKEAGVYSGFYPLAKHAEWEKTAVLTRKLGSMRDKIRELEKTIQSMTKTEK
ncbi:UDP-3-O-(3-hydroxymyristoyl)glucosamine N-acyltransferase [Oxalobacter sp. OxGP1]|uniref:UDP-3-O-(3-hydroxymyristoyl)glucosamine N-acyltransferase n=1 Tax=Oxalobacter paeniformigenes TaxID=2946594 RepID=UPI0022AEBBC0|nr:UDP-3-O-(3-hydroxymyristoyl)glucosamine N-acyltransferase [Oxalobacter paeniformigenes]MCZ4053723.1 UDP-3-O-(3-hydroxymyristoyl)glucosamine N-acyltransferase [Oxalobacter paeniformigenes]